MELLRQFPALARTLSYGLIFIGLISLAAIAVACIYAEWDTIIPMLSVTGSLCAAGVILRFIPQNGVKPTPALFVAMTVILWGFVALCGSFPFLFAGLSFIDAAFESMSAWTGTGFSVVAGIEAWPHAILFWRSLMEWVGCLGIIVFALSVTANAGISRSLFRTEGRVDTFLPSVKDTAHQMLKIYLILTLIAIAAIFCTGVGIWDAVNLAFCGVSTGGMALYSDGIAHYNNIGLEIVLIPVMFMGAIPFRLYYLLYKKSSIKKILHDRVLYAMLIVFIALAVFLVLDLMFSSGLSLEDSLRQGVFMAGSAVSSTGYQNTTLLSWGPAPLLVLGIFLFIGGAQGSTAGGIKMDRILVTLESIVWWMKKTISSSKAVVSMRHDGKAVKDDEAASLISGSVVIILCFLALLAAVLIILLHDPYFSSNISGTIFGVLNCVANTGASAGLVGPDMPGYAKIIFIFVMWAARLEIIPVIILINAVVHGFKSK